MNAVELNLIWLLEVLTITVFETKVKENSRRTKQDRINSSPP